MGDDAFVLSGRLQVDSSDIEAVQDDARSALARVDNLKGKIKVGVRDEEAQRGLKQIEQKAEKLDRTKIRPRIDVDTSAADKGLEDLKRRIAETVARANKLAASTTARGTGTSTTGGLGGSLAGSGSSGRGGGLGAGVAQAFLSVVGAIGVKEAYSRSVGAESAARRLEGIAGRAFGAEAPAYIAAAKQMQDATGFLTADVMAATLQMRQLATNYGLTNDQITRMVGASADLAATSPYEDLQSVADVSTQLAAALHGQTQGTEQLGLALNDNHMKTMAFGGSLKGTWEKMSMAERAQWRYKEILSQTAAFTGAASDETDEYGRQTRLLRAELSESAKTIGGPVMSVVTQLLKLLNSLPSEVVTGGVAVGSAAALVGGIAGSGLMAKGLWGRFVGNAAGEAAGEVGGEVIGGLGKRLLGRGAKNTAGKVGKEIAEEVGQAVAEGAARGVPHWSELAGKVIPKATWATSSASGAAGLGGALGVAAIALPAVVGTAMGLDLYTKHVRALDAKQKREGAALMTQRYKQQLEHGIDWGVYRDSATGEVTQGAPVGWDEGAKIPIYANRSIGGRMQRRIIGYQQSTEINKFGARLGAPNFGYVAEQQAQMTARAQSGASPLPGEMPPVNVNVGLTVRDATSGGVTANLDAQSYSTDNY